MALRSLKGMVSDGGHLVHLDFVFDEATKRGNQGGTKPRSESTRLRQSKIINLARACAVIPSFVFCIRREVLTGRPEDNSTQDNLGYVETTLGPYRTYICYQNALGY